MRKDIIVDDSLFPMKIHTSDGARHSPSKSNVIFAETLHHLPAL